MPVTRFAARRCITATIQIRSGSSGRPPHKESRAPDCAEPAGRRRGSVQGGFDLSDYPLDFVIRSVRPVPRRARHNGGRLGVFGVGLRMEDMRFHRPTIRRIFASQFPRRERPAQPRYGFSSMRRCTVCDQSPRLRRITRRVIQTSPGPPHRQRHRGAVIRISVTSWSTRSYSWHQLSKHLAAKGKTALTLLW